MPNDDFLELTYEECTWPLIWRSLTITPAERRIVCESADENAHITKTDRRCSEAEWQKLKALLAACDFDAWQSEYFAPVLDGTRWHLTIRRADGRIKESDGMNAYPEGWEPFAALCDCCAELSAPAQ